jgi:hypothetical protein
MQENDFGPTGPQLYVLSERHYIHLRHTQTMMDDMAHVVFNDSHREQGNQRLVVSRAELKYLFAGISELIGRALDGVKQENGVLPWERVRQ